MEFSTLAVGRYPLKVFDIAGLLGRHPNSVTKWLNKGLRLQREDPEFKERLDHLGAFSQPLENSPGFRQTHSLDDELFTLDSL